MTTGDSLIASGVASSTARHARAGFSGSPGVGVNVFPAPAHLAIVSAPDAARVAASRRPFDHADMASRICAFHAMAGPGPRTTLLRIPEFYPLRPAARLLRPPPAVRR